MSWTSKSSTGSRPAMAAILNSFSQVEVSFASLAQAVTGASAAAGHLLPGLHREPDLFAPASSPQPWALHSRDKTSLELAIEQWKRDNPPRAYVPLPDVDVADVRAGRNDLVGHGRMRGLRCSLV